MFPLFRRQLLCHPVPAGVVIPAFFAAGIIAAVIVHLLDREVPATRSADHGRVFTAPLLTMSLMIRRCSWRRKRRMKMSVRSFFMESPRFQTSFRACRQHLASVALQFSPQSTFLYKPTLFGQTSPNSIALIISLSCFFSLTFSALSRVIVVSGLID